MIAYQLTRSEVARKFTTEEFAYYRAADELGIWPDLIMETAKLRATIVAMMSTGRRSINIVDYLPDAMTPSGPDPEGDARAMESFISGFKAIKGK